MQTPAFPALNARLKSFTNRSAHESSGHGFLDTHPIVDVVRSLFLSSILWAMLAVTVYTVYSMFV